MLVFNELAKEELKSIKKLDEEFTNTRSMKNQYLKNTRTHLNTSYRALRELQKLSKKKRLYDVNQKNNYIQLSSEFMEGIAEGKPTTYDYTSDLSNEYHESFSSNLKELQSTRK